MNESLLLKRVTCLRNGREVITQTAASSPCFSGPGIGMRKDRGSEIIQKIKQPEGSSVTKKNFQIYTFHLFAFYFFLIPEELQLAK